MYVIIVGCGRVGAELAHSVAYKGHAVVVIDRNPESFQRLEHEFHGRSLQGDIRDRNVLTRADIEHADGFAAVTSNDEINLVAAHTALELYNVPNIVARVYDPVHAQAFKRAGIKTVISSSWSAHRIEQLLTHPGITELASVGNGEVLMVEVLVPGNMVGKPISFFTQESACQPAALIHAGQADLVQPDTILEDGDLIVAAVLSSNMSRLENFLGFKGE
jgi:trk system potassium uptake protein TrkA